MCKVNTVLLEKKKRKSKYGDNVCQGLTCYKQWKWFRLKEEVDAKALFFPAIIVIILSPTFTELVKISG